MARRYIGDAVVDVQVDDKTITMGPRVGYKGVVRAGGHRWPFDGLFLNVSSKAADSPDMYDEAAATAVVFGSYYTSNNRREARDWAPDPSTADAIYDAVSTVTNDAGQYLVQRKPGGRGRFAGER